MKKFHVGLVRVEREYCLVEVELEDESSDERVYEFAIRALDLYIQTSEEVVSFLSKEEQLGKIWTRTSNKNVEKLFVLGDQEDRLDIALLKIWRIEQEKK